LLNILEKRILERERESTYGLHLYYIEVYQTKLNRSLFIKRQSVVSKKP